MTKRDTKNGKHRPKIAAELPSLVPQPHGGALYAGGVPGHDGSNAGRPPDDYKQWLRDIRNKPNARKVFEAHVESGDIKFWDHAAKYSETPMPQEHKVAATVTFKAVRE